jgi:hypothetical protein
MVGLFQKYDHASLCCLMGDGPSSAPSRKDDEPSDKLEADLERELGGLFQRGEKVDILFGFDTCFGPHRAVLCARSAYFKDSVGSTGQGCRGPFQVLSMCVTCSNDSLGFCIIPERSSYFGLCWSTSVCS